MNAKRIAQSVGVFAAIACVALVHAGGPSSSADGFLKAGSEPALLWHDVPFLEGADVAQYEATSRQSRDGIRQRLFGDLRLGLQQSGSEETPSAATVEALVNALLTFDLMHDLHQSADTRKLNVSLGAKFKASLDQRFIDNDIRPQIRRLQISAGSDSARLRDWADRVTKSGVGLFERPQLKETADVLRPIDYVAVGTFASLGAGEFEVTVTLQNLRTGNSRSFSAKGALLQAVDTVAGKVFDQFQGNHYPSWTAAGQSLDWLAMPANPSRDAPGAPNYGYSFQEAQEYCASRGYRLPFLRELLAAESGGAYQPGGIARLKPGVSYPVLDRRHSSSRYVVRLGENPADPEGALHSVAAFPGNGEFWCVRGEISPAIAFRENLWQLHREFQTGDADKKEVFAAIETLRFELGDADARESYFNNQSTGNRFDQVTLLPSPSRAVATLRAAGISLEIPPSLGLP